MRYDLTACDGCGKMAAETKRVSIYLGRRNDGAGGMENITNVVDLCIECLAGAVNGLIALDVREPSATNTAWLLGWISRKHKTEDYHRLKRLKGETDLAANPL